MVRYRSEIKVLVDRKLRAGLGQQHDIAGAMSKRTGAKPLHAPFQIDQIRARMES